MANTFKRLLVPLDGSSASAQVLDYLRPLLTSFESILLMHVVPEDPLPAMMMEDHGGALSLASDETDGPTALAYMTRVREGFGAAADKTLAIARAGAPASEIIDAAEREEVSLIAMTTHGAGGVARWAMGSQTERVVRASRVPVLVVPSTQRTRTKLPANIQHVLVPIDGSERALALVHSVKDLAGVGKARVTLAHFVGHEPSDETEEQGRAYLRRARCAFEDVGIAPRTRLIRDAPATGIVDYALPALDDDVPVDMIAMTTHGRSGLARWTLGSVTERVMRHTMLPMIIVRNAV